MMKRSHTAKPQVKLHQSKCSCIEIFVSLHKDDQRTDEHCDSQDFQYNLDQFRLLTCNTTTWSSPTYNTETSKNLISSVTFKHQPTSC